MKKQILAAVLCVGAAVTTAQAQVFVRIGPPTPRYERVPPPRRGYEWRPGYHRWDGRRYVWVGGSYVRPPRPGVHWVPGHWDHERRGNFWVEGHWA